ncbi:dockerin type I domain-containing protein, partial [Lentimicrobium sp.]|uniref:dockerin type I domain-containing protein n=1 Tax=Lentimicrobium sp. TaxID=2034841 RepID=UPI002CD6C7A7
PDMASWRSLTGLDMNSVSSDPGFVSNTDLHCTSLAFDNLGTPVPAVVLDIDGDPRSPATPDIGADEFSNDPAEKTLTLEVFLEGLYNGANSMRQAFDENGPHFGPGVADQIVIELHDASGYGNIAYTSPPVNLGTNGQAVITVPGTFSGSYYITIRHRNSIATTTAAPVSFSNSSVALNLDHPSKAFGGNLLMMIDGKYVIYGGDVNQDGSVDTADMTPVDNDASAFATGYLATDVNGDGTIDTGDMTIIDNNAAAFVSSVTP